jgi:CDP-4-dehydro-6-deoxyglucose reductase
MRHPFQCIATRQITEDICLLEFKPLTHTIAYIPGQYVLATLQQGEKIALSIANESQGLLEFHLRHNDNQPLAQMLLRHLASNTVIEMEGPFGSSTVNQIQKHKPVIFLSGGTGFAPFQSLIGALLKNTYQQRISLYWGLRDLKDAYALDLIEQWQKEYVRFEFNLVLSDKVPPTWQGATGLVHNFVAEKHLDMTDYQVFASGPLEMIKLAFKKFVANGLPSSSFYTDLRFD